MSETPTKAEVREALRRRDRKQRQREAKAARPRSEKATRERNPGHLAFLRRQPCAVAHLGGCNGAVPAAHVRFACATAGKPITGMQTKPDDRYAAPLCAHHHLNVQHAMNERRFWEAAGIDALSLTSRLFTLYAKEAG